MFKKTPPMGWNSWNTFGENINEDVVRETADAMVARGLKDAGYEYVVIDDCWSLRERGADGRIVADPKKFPSGMKALADYIHSKGLKFGMYSCDGTKTCAMYPASFDHEFIDAETFAEFGVDYLKYDNCFKPDYVPGKLLYNRMSMALKATGRDILFSACNWGNDDVETWIRSTGANLYRSTGDISDNFESFKGIAISQIPKLCHMAPGCFNDIDMLICGMNGKGNVANGGCTQEQYLMHFALWCLYAAPLMIGCDIRNCDDATIDILKNKALIAIDQDEEVRPPMIINNCSGNYGVMTMLRHMSNNEYILAGFNMENGKRHLISEFAEIGLPVNCGYAFDLTDVMTGEHKGIVTENLYEYVEPYTFKMYRAKLVKIK